MAGFPRMLFYGGVMGEPRLVDSDAEDAQARADGWLTFGEVSHGINVAPDMTREDVMTELDRRGIEYDGRWGIARLKAALV